jgi:hypothetical protein
MLLFFSWSVLAVLGQAPEAVPPGALHVAVRSEFNYLGSARTAQGDFWVSGNKLWRKRGAQVVPYQGFPGGTARPDGPEDLHTAGFDYRPEFFWNTNDTDETRTILGRDCRLTTATGTAAYAQTELRLWFCASRGEEESAVSGLLSETAGGQYRGIAVFAAEEARRRAGRVLLALEETTEPSIAPVQTRKMEATAMDSAPPAQ